LFRPGSCSQLQLLTVASCFSLGSRGHLLPLTCRELEAIQSFIGAERLFRAGAARAKLVACSQLQASRQLVRSFKLVQSCKFCRACWVLEARGEQWKLNETELENCQKGWLDVVLTNARARERAVCPQTPSQLCASVSIQRQVGATKTSDEHRVATQLIPRGCSQSEISCNHNPRAAFPYGAGSQLPRR
jgi:hypothetical protein